MALKPPILLWTGPAALAAVLASGLATPAAAAAALPFEERVACREKVEDVYWAHRLWPRENQAPKPPREAAVPRAAVASRIDEALRYEAALATQWGEALTPGAIQAEIDREARSTRDPAMLRDLWAALGNDPALVAECLVRPELAERRIKEHYAGDRILHAATRRRAESELAEAAAGGGLAALRTGTGRVTAMVWVEKSGGTERQLSPGTIALDSDEWSRLENALVEAFAAAPSAPAASGVPATGESGAASGTSAPAWSSRRSLATPRPSARSWSAEKRTLAGLPLGELSPLREDGDGFHAVQLQDRSAGRVQVVTVTWPKQAFGEWWQRVRESFPAWAPAAGVYRLAALAGRACAYDTWVNPSNLVLPTARSSHTAVWTGTEMIVWGGAQFPSGLELASGGRYTPGTDSWAGMTTTGAPSPRTSHTAVWTGSEMIVWGGTSSHFPVGASGGRYAPATDGWVATNQTGAPAGRSLHTAVWTGDGDDRLGRIRRH